MHTILDKQLDSLVVLTCNVIVIWIQIWCHSEAEVGEERVAGEDDAGEDGEVEGHQHREVGPGVDSLHYSEQEGLEDLVGVGRPRPQPRLHQP